jgi:hypothetical protein
MIAQIEGMMSSSLTKMRLQSASSAFDVEKALKSMRKLPLMGNTSKQVDFECPSVDELRQFCNGERVKIVSFEFSKCDVNHPGLNSFQLNYSNGIKTVQLKARAANDMELK